MISAELSWDWGSYAVGVGLSGLALVVTLMVYDLVQRVRVRAFLRSAGLRPQPEVSQALQALATHGLPRGGGAAREVWLGESRALIAGSGPQGPWLLWIQGVASAALFPQLTLQLPRGDADAGATQDAGDDANLAHQRALWVQHPGALSYRRLRRLVAEAARR